MIHCMWLYIIASLQIFTHKQKRSTVQGILCSTVDTGWSASSSYLENCVLQCVFVTVPSISMLPCILVVHRHVINLCSKVVGAVDSVVLKSDRRHNNNNTVNNNQMCIAQVCRVTSEALCDGSLFTILLWCLLMLILWTPCYFFLWNLVRVCVCVCMYTVGHKKVPLIFFYHNFDNFRPILLILFTFAFWGKVHMMLEYILTPHLKSVAALLRDISMFNYTASIHA